MNTIDIAGESHLALVDDILDVSKIKAGRLALHTAPASMPLLLAAAVVLLRQPAATTNITLPTAVAPAVPDYIATDGGASAPFWATSSATP